MKVLYLGLDAPKSTPERHITHYPIITIKPLVTPEVLHLCADMQPYTHLLFTSKSAVKLFFTLANPIREADSGMLAQEKRVRARIPGDGVEENRTLERGCRIVEKRILSVGASTTACLQRYGVMPHFTAVNESSEGIIDILEQEDLRGAHLFWPHSALSRDVIPRYLQQRGVPLTHCILYDTVAQTPEPIPKLQEYDEIVFTSPSTVDAFLGLFGSIPNDKKISCIGPVTRDYLLRSSGKGL